MSQPCPDLRTEADAYLYFERLRWNGAPKACPHCGSKQKCYYLDPANGTSRATRTGAQSQRRVWKCAACHQQFSVLTGTAFEGTRVPLRTWVTLIFDVCNTAGTISSRKVAERYEVTAKTAHRMIALLLGVFSAETPFGAELRRKMPTGFDTP